MKTTQETGKRIVSKSVFANGLLRRLGLLISGFAGVVLGGALCGGIPVCLFYILREFHFNGWLTAGVLALASLSAYLGRRFIQQSEIWFYKVQDIPLGVPLTRASAADFPAPVSLVRASSEPIQAYNAILLRAATGETQEGQEQLLRAAGGPE